MPETNFNQSLPMPNPEALPAPKSQSSEIVQPQSSETARVEAPAAQEALIPHTEIGPQNAGAPQQATSLPQPINPSAGVAAPAKQADPIVDNSPAVADDVDLIEKEWVQKAKSIVDQHHDDPYRQEEEANKLQSNYLKKRYGKSIKKKN